MAGDLRSTQNQAQDEGTHLRASGALLRGEELWRLAAEPGRRTHSFYTGCSALARRPRKWSRSGCAAASRHLSSRCPVACLPAPWNQGVKSRALISPFLCARRLPAGWPSTAHRAAWSARLYRFTACRCHCRSRLSCEGGCRAAGGPDPAGGFRRKHLSPPILGFISPQYERLIL